MKIIIEGNLVDYIDENELKSDVRHQIKNEIFIDRLDEIIEKI